MNLNRENMIRMMQLILFTVVVLAAALNYNRVLLLLARGIRCNTGHGNPHPPASF